MAKTGSNGNVSEQQRATKARAAATDGKAQFHGLKGMLSLGEKHDFAELEADSVFVSEFPAYLYQFRMIPGRGVVIDMQGSELYRHEMMDAVTAATKGFVWVKMFYVPRSALLDEDPDMNVRKWQDPPEATDTDDDDLADMINEAADL